MSTLRLRPMREVPATPLDTISSNIAALTVKSCLVLHGTIDMKRFATALQQSIDFYTPWIVCALYVRDDGSGVVAAPRNDGCSSDGYLDCELCDVDAPYSHADVDVSTILPQRVHEKMNRVELAFLSVHELPICALRVTRYLDRVCIGYCLNHAFFDQSAIVYFFSFLSNLYTNNGVPTIKCPVFVPRAQCVQSEFSSYDDFVNAAPSGYSSSTSSGCNGGGEFKVIPHQTITLVFNASSIERLKRQSSSNHHISTNDIIHAVLLKILARASKDDDDDNDDDLLQSRSSARLRLLFARNMRSCLKRGPEVFGDYVRMEELSMSVDDDAAAPTSSLASLAEKSREVVSDRSSADRFKQEIMWMLGYSRFHEGCKPPVPDYLTDRHAVIVSNWSSFPYNDIHFDSCHFELLRMADSWVGTSGAFVRVVDQGRRDHDNTGGRRDSTTTTTTIVAVIDTIYQSVIDAARTISSSDCDGNLYSCSS